MDDWFYRLFINDLKAIVGGYATSSTEMVDLIEGDLIEVNIPDKCEKIRKYAFYGMETLENVILPRSVKVVEDLAFQNCIGLAKVSFEGVPIEVSSSAFLGCTSLLNIYVPWQEGEIVGAPWGASNATIHYGTNTSESTTAVLGKAILGKAILGRS